MKWNQKLFFLLLIVAAGSSSGTSFQRRYLRRVALYQTF